MNMENKGTLKSVGKIPKWLLILGGIFILILIITIAGGGKEKKEGVAPAIEKPITEAVLGNIKFRLVEAKDLGNVLKGIESRYPKWKKDLTTEGKFIWVEVSQENVGKVSTYTRAPDIVDNQNRQFPPFVEASDWIPEERNCGIIGKELKPGFSSVNCIFIYEVPKDATGLKLKLGTIETKYIDLGL